MPANIVLLAVVWRLRYTLSLRDVAELLEREFTVTHEQPIRAEGTTQALLVADDVAMRAPIRNALGYTNDIR